MNRYPPLPQATDRNPTLGMFGAECACAGPILEPAGRWESGAHSTGGGPGIRWASR
jgi:hypothetical protein